MWRVFNDAFSVSVGSIVPKRGVKLKISLMDVQAIIVSWAWGIDARFTVFQLFLSFATQILKDTRIVNNI